MLVGRSDSCRPIVTSSMLCKIHYISISYHLEAFTSPEKFVIFLLQMLRHVQKLTSYYRRQIFAMHCGIVNVVTMNKNVVRKD